MAELVPGGEKDSVVYLGRNSFKMKVGVRTTPPAETAPTAPPAPRITTPPQPVARASRAVSPSSGSHISGAHGSGGHGRPAVAREGQQADGVALAKSTLVGLCLTAFSCGIMCTVAVDRYWPRARAACVGPHAAAAPALVAPVFETPAHPAPAANVAEVMALPPYGEKLPTADTAAAAEIAAAPAVAAAPSPPARPLAAPATRAAAPARSAPAQGRTVARKRTGPTAATADRAASPTESWTDPFAE